MKGTQTNTLDTVDILKQATDKEDKYLICKINTWQFNGEPDYVFENSTPVAQLAIYMDQDGPEHPL